MKLLFFNTYYYPYKVGGAEVSVQLLAEELVNQGNEVVVISLGEHSDIKVINGVKVYYLAIRNLYLPATYKANILQKAVWHTLDSYNPLYNKKITKIIKNESPDLIHTHNIAGFSVSVWNTIKSQFDLPVVHTIRDYYLFCVKGRMYDHGKQCDRQCRICSATSVPKKMHSQNVDSITGISTYVLQKHIQEGYFKDATYSKVIPNPVNVQSINSKDKVRNYRKDKVVLGFLGRLEPAKGIEFVLENLPSVGSIKLIIGGSGEEKYVSRLKKDFESDNVHFLGYVNPSEFFGKIDFLVVPSLWEEPFGRVVIEAYTAGVPVIGSNRGGITDLIENGRTGWLFNPSQESEFYSILANLPKPTTELYRVLTENCIKKSQLYASDHIVNLYLDTYNNLIR